MEGLDRELYIEFKAELEEKIANLNQQYEKSNLKSSNLEKCLTICEDLSQNLCKYWASGGMEIKLKLQDLLFPEGLVLDAKNRVLRTKKTNMMFDIKPCKSSGWEPVNENSQVNFTWESLLVAGE